MNIYFGQTCSFSCFMLFQFFLSITVLTPFTSWPSSHLRRVVTSCPCCHPPQISVTSPYSLGCIGTSRAGIGDAGDTSIRYAATCWFGCNVHWQATRCAEHACAHVLWCWCCNRNCAHRSPLFQHASAVIIVNNSHKVRSSALAACWGSHWRIAHCALYSLQDTVQVGLWQHCCS